MMGTSEHDIPRRAHLPMTAAIDLRRATDTRDRLTDIHRQSFGIVFVDAAPTASGGVDRRSRCEGQDRQMIFLCDTQRGHVDASGSALLVLLRQRTSETLLARQLAELLVSRGSALTPHHRVGFVSRLPRMTPSETVAPPAGLRVVGWDRTNAKAYGATMLCHDPPDTRRLDTRNRSGSGTTTL